MAYRDNYQPTIDWLKAAKEIANVPGGVAVLRILEAHGVNKLSNEYKDDRPPNTGEAMTSIRWLIDKVHENL